MIARQVDVLFCDDIREEVGNKVSYMGIYTGVLQVQSMPSLLGKLCVVVRLQSDLKKPFEQIEIRIVKEKGREEVEELLNTGVIQQPAEIPVLDEWANRYLAQFHFVLQSFPVEDSFDLRVKVRTESEDLEGTALRIRVADPHVELPN
jgi:hypothetical protein